MPEKQHDSTTCDICKAAEQKSSPLYLESTHVFVYDRGGCSLIVAPKMHVTHAVNLYMDHRIEMMSFIVRLQSAVDLDYATHCLTHFPYWKVGDASQRHYHAKLEFQGVRSQETLLEHLRGLHI